MIINALKYQPLQNINHCKAALNKLEALPASPLLSDLIKQAAEYNPKYYKFLKEKSSKKKFLKKAFSENKEPDSARDNALQTKEKDGLQTKNNNSQALTQAPAPAPAQAQTQTKTEAAELCRYLIELILKNNARASVPKRDSLDPLFKKWTKEIDKLHRLGPVGAKKSENKGYNFPEIRAIINFSQQDQFWKNNILSAGKLRKQIIKLENKMKSSNYNPAKQQTNILKELYLAAREEENNEKK